MTLCAAWIRQVKDNQELIFATDSCLSGGLRWHSGVKLFELPRKDCLICFAGDTDRTYPLILNLISSIKFDNHLANPHTDVAEVLEYLSNLFTTLCNSITNFQGQTFEEVLGNFEFLFGGWSWKNQKFHIWSLKYNFEMKSFLHTEMGNDSMAHAFIGDELDKSRELLEEEIKASGKVLARDFDMEPLKVLLKMIRDTEYTTIDGAIQIAKIYPPGVSEFFGVMWPSIDGKKTFLGKDVSFENNPAVKFIDPDTGDIIGDELPDKLSDIAEEIYAMNCEFVKDCYPEGKQKDHLTEKERYTLRSIFRDVAYSLFLAKEQEKTLDESEE